MTSAITAGFHFVMTHEQPEEAAARVVAARAVLEGTLGAVHGMDGAGHGALSQPQLQLVQPDDGGQGLAHAAAGGPPDPPRRA